jgi:hypothetical protein
VRPSSERIGWAIDILKRNAESLQGIYRHAPSTMQSGLKEVKQGVDSSILILKEIVEHKKRKREKELENK